MIIYKYILGPSTELQLSEHSEVLTVHVQGNNICLWVKIPTDRESSIVEKRCFRTVPTGAEFDGNNLKYIGTSFMDDGLVFHTFEEIRW